MAQKKIDEITGVATTGHEWDGLEELNTPLPRWWLWLFYICIVWAIGYYFVYPSWPLINGYTKGFLGYSQRQAALDDVAAGAASRTEIGKALSAASLDQIRADPKMLEFAMANGKSAFGNNCAPCHGSGATGSPGYPNLQDDDWLWGGSLDAIQQTITVGGATLMVLGSLLLVAVHFVFTVPFLTSWVVALAATRRRSVRPTWASRSSW